MKDIITDNNKIASIILLTDFSDNAKNAIKYAINAFGDNVTYNLVNSYYVKTTSGTLLDLNDILAKESEEELAKEEKWIRSEFPNLNLTIKSHSVFGDPVDAIKKLTKHFKHDLVVMGTKGASGMDALLYGSVAASVIKASIIPVISIPPGYEYSEINKIVFATDNQGDVDATILAPIHKIQALFNSEITVLTVEKPAEAPINTTFDLKIKDAHYSVIESEEIVEEVVKYCIDEEANMLVLLPKHTSFLSRLFHKSISRQIIQKAKIPILSLENTKN